MAGHYGGALSQGAGIGDTEGSFSLEQWRQHNGKGPGEYPFDGTNRAWDDNKKRRMENAMNNSWHPLYDRRANTGLGITRSRKGVPRPGGGNYAAGEKWYGPDGKIVSLSDYPGFPLKIGQTRFGPKSQPNRTGGVESAGGAGSGEHAQAILEGAGIGDKPGSFSLEQWRQHNGHGPGVYPYDGTKLAWDDNKKRRMENGMNNSWHPNYNRSMNTGGVTVPQKGVPHPSGGTYATGEKWYGPNGEVMSLSDFPGFPLKIGQTRFGPGATGGDPAEETGTEPPTDPPIGTFPTEPPGTGPSGTEPPGTEPPGTEPPPPQSPSPIGTFPNTGPSGTEPPTATAGNWHQDPNTGQWTPQGPQGPSGTAIGFGWQQDPNTGQWIETIRGTDPGDPNTGKSSVKSSPSHVGWRQDPNTGQWFPPATERQPPPWSQITSWPTAVRPRPGTQWTPQGPSGTDPQSPPTWKPPPGYTSPAQSPPPRAIGGGPSGTGPAISTAGNWQQDPNTGQWTQIPDGWEQDPKTGQWFPPTTGTQSPPFHIDYPQSTQRPELSMTIQDPAPQGWQQDPNTGQWTPPKSSIGITGAGSGPDGPRRHQRPTVPETDPGDPYTGLLYSTPPGGRKPPPGWKPSLGGGIATEPDAPFDFGTNPGYVDDHKTWHQDNRPQPAWQGLLGNIENQSWAQSPGAQEFIAQLAPMFEKMQQGQRDQYPQLGQRKFAGFDDDVGGGDGRPFDDQRLFPGSTSHHNVGSGVPDYYTGQPIQMGPKISRVHYQGLGELRKELQQLETLGKVEHDAKNESMRARLTQQMEEQIARGPRSGTDRLGNEIDREGWDQMVRDRHRGSIAQFVQPYEQVLAKRQARIKGLEDQYYKENPHARPASFYPGDQGGDGRQRIVWEDDAQRGIDIGGKLQKEYADYIRSKPQVNGGATTGNTTIDTSTPEQREALAEWEARAPEWYRKMRDPKRLYTDQYTGPGDQGQNLKPGRRWRDERGDTSREAYDKWNSYEGWRARQPARPLGQQKPQRQKPQTIHGLSEPAVPSGLKPWERIGPNGNVQGTSAGPLPGRVELGEYTNYDTRHHRVPSDTSREAYDKWNSYEGWRARQPARPLGQQGPMTLTEIAQSGDRHQGDLRNLPAAQPWQPGDPMGDINPRITRKPRLQQRKPMTGKAIEVIEQRKPQQRKPSPRVPGKPQPLRPQTRGRKIPRQTVGQFNSRTGRYAYGGRK